NTAAASVVYTVTSTDPDTVCTRSSSLSLTHAAQFNIDTTTGAVTFKVAPDFEAPTDAGADNVYDIVVHANDGVHDTTQAVAITRTEERRVGTESSSAATAGEGEKAAAGGGV